MWQKAGIIKSEKTLREAATFIKSMISQKHLWRFSNAHELKNLFEFDAALFVAQIICQSALERKESRGAHYRKDYPKMSNQWERNIIIKKL